MEEALHHQIPPENPQEQADASTMMIEIGPAHPAMHGIVRFTTWIDGEEIVDMVPDIGYLHRGFEKESENSKWIQITPYTDRLNYVSPLLCNIGFAEGVEKLFGVEAPRRAQFHPRHHGRNFAYYRPPDMRRRSCYGSRRVHVFFFGSSKRESTCGSW